MTFNISCIKPSIIRHNFKRYWWISALYTIAMLLASPLMILMNNSYKYLLEQVTKDPERMGFVLRNDGGAYFFIAFVPVLVAVCVFRYMQQNRSVTLFHSMPFTRSQLYSGSFLSGWLLFAIPLVITALVLAYMSAFTIYGNIFTLFHVYEWLFRLLLFGTVLYTLTILVGMFTGSSIAQFLFVYILNGLPFILTAMFYLILDSWLFGFAADGITFAMNTILKYSPIYLLSNELEWFQVLLNIGYIVLAFAIGLYAYQKRHVEHSGDIIAYNWFSHVFLYGVTTCCMLVGVAFIKSVLGGANPNIVVYLLWAMLGFAIAKMLLIKSFRILKYYKGLLVFFAVTVCCFYAVEFDITGYGQKMPDEQNIKAVYVGSYVPNNIFDETYLKEGGMTSGVLLKQPENIKEVIKLQQSAVTEKVLAKNVKNSLLDSYRKNYFVYLTKSGRKIVRAYYLKRNEVSPVFESSEAKDFTHAYVRIYHEKIDYIQLNLWDEKQSKDISLVDEKKEAFLDALNKDLNVLSYPERTDAYNSKTKPFANVQFFMLGDENNRRVYSLELSEQFTNTVDWLKTNGYPIKSYTDSH